MQFSRRELLEGKPSYFLVHNWCFVSRSSMFYILVGFIHVCVHSLHSNPYLKFLGCAGSDENENHETHKESVVENNINDVLSNSSRKTNDNNTLQQNDKVFFSPFSIFGLLVFILLWHSCLLFLLLLLSQKIPRNKVCPCGSKKKYKACCGTASGKQSAKLVVYASYTYIFCSLVIVFNYSDNSCSV